MKYGFVSAPPFINALVVMHSTW